MLLYPHIVPHVTPSHISSSNTRNYIQSNFTYQIYTFSIDSTFPQSYPLSNVLIKYQIQLQYIILKHFSAYFHLFFSHIFMSLT